ncbi:MAG: hypothetical protein QW104_03595 [Nitrososphaerota archaeon]
MMTELDKLKKSNENAYYLLQLAILLIEKTKIMVESEERKRLNIVLRELTDVARKIKKGR